MNSAPLFRTFLISLTLLASIFGRTADASGCAPGAPCLPDNLVGNFESSDRTRAALFMLGLYEKGIAGGKTGICLDYVGAQFNIGFNTESFVTGKSEFNGNFEKDGAKKLETLIKDLSQAQRGKALELEIDGYADGQHYDQFYKGSGSLDSQVEQSIAANEALAKGRAGEIARYLQSKNPSNVIVSSNNVRGHASPELERAFKECVIKNGVKSRCGVDCGTRRKVVIQAKLPSGQLDPNGTGGNYYPKTKQLSESERSVLGAEISKQVRTATRDLERTPDFAAIPVTKKSELIFEKLLADKKISPVCAQDPILKGFTLAYLDSSIDPSKRLFSEFLEKRFGPNYARYVDKHDMMAVNTAMPTDRFWCFKVEDSFFDRVDPKQNRSVLDKSLLSGRELVKQLKGDQLNGDAKFGIGFDPDRMQAITTTDRKGALKGIVCKACGSGISFNKNSSGGYEATLDDRSLIGAQSNGGSAQKEIWDAFQKAGQADPFSVAAMSRPRTFVVPNCRDCKCDVRGKIRAGGKDLITIDPLSNPQSVQTLKNVSKSTLENACVFNHPVFHSCMVAPDVQDDERAEDAETFLSFYNPMTGVVERANDIDQALKKITEKSTLACGQVTGTNEAGPITYQEKVNSVSCSGDINRALPTAEEKKDCAPELGHYSGSVK